MSLEVLSPRALLGVFRDQRLETVTNYWRNLGGFTRNIFQSPNQKIIWEKIVGNREVATFSLPQNPGRPSYRRRGSTAASFEPAYIKLKDPVIPGEQFTRRPGNLYDDAPRTPAQNRDAEIAAILEHHRKTIERREEIMAFQAVTYGKVLVEYRDGPTVEVDYGRDSALTDILTTGFWDANTDIPAKLQEYTDSMANAEFGGRGSVVTMGREVWRVMRSNTKLLELMDTQIRGGEGNSIARSLIAARTPDAPWTVVGQLPGLTLVLYEDFYEDNNGNHVDIMNPRDLVITSADYGGVSAYGAILEIESLLAQPVFVKQWIEQDPSAMNIMTQSAPLMISPFPNRSFHARPVEEDSNS